jgi:RNA polymerase sigma-70 factor (ECF subfamily)
METAHRARGGRRQNLSLRHLAPLRGRRDRETAAAQTAFEAFYREHVASVYQYALAVLANPADAEDVTQQTFLNAYRAFQRGERPEKEHNWVIKIAHNVCRMRWRQSARRPQELPLETAREPATNDEDKPALDDVLAALGRLPFNQRSALVMRELEDRTYAEIAEVLGTSVSAVEALLFRARTNLRANRSAIGVLTVVPVPASLGSFFGGGSSGVIAAGGIALGTDVVLKAAAVVATGVVVGGIGYKSVNAVAEAKQPPVTFSERQYAAPLVWASPLARLVSGTPLARQQAAAAARLRAAAGLAPGMIRVGSGLPDIDARLDGEAAAAAAAGVPGAAAGAAAGEPGSAVPGVTAPVLGPAPAPAPGSVTTPPVPNPVSTATSSAGVTVPTPTTQPSPSPLPLPPPPVPLPPPPVTVPSVTVPTVSTPIPVPTVGLPPPPPIIK